MLPPLLNQSHRLTTPVSLEHCIKSAGFIKQFLQQPRNTGAIAPSSTFVARRVTDLIRFDTAQTIVELGPGSGAFTEHLIQRISPSSRFFALEINAEFAAATRKRCPQTTIYTAPATSLPDHLNASAGGRADCIVSSLPWTIFSESQQNELLETVASCLTPNGTFLSIVYLGSNLRSGGRRFMRNIEHHFSNIQRHGPVWLNLPPTLIIECTR